MSALKYTLLAALAVSVGVMGHPRNNGRHVVYMNHNNYPSLLYINNVHGGQTRVSNRPDTSDIIQLILYPSGQEADRSRKATVVLMGDAQGILTLTQNNPPVGPTVIEGDVFNLTTGFHGFHIHALGDLSGGCVSAGGHYNPYMKDHGGPEHRERHVGDLGNIYADATGLAKVNITDELVSLVGPRGVVGRAIVIHAGEDDMGRGGDEGSRKTGNAGGRVGCGVIGHA